MYKNGDCVFLQGSTQPDGKKGLPVLCIQRECTGRKIIAEKFQCYLPILDEDIKGELHEEKL